MRIIAAFALLLALTVPVSVHAQTFGAIGTRAEGMAGAFVAVADDASAVYWNPAGIATGATFDLQVSTGRESTVFVGAAFPCSAQATTAPIRPPVSLQFQTHRTDKTGDREQVPIRTLTTNNVGVTFVQTVVTALVIGSTVRVVHGGIEPFDSRTTVDLDAGAMLSAWDMRFGLTARNLTEPEFQGDGGKVQMTRQFRVGAALVPRSLPTGVHGPFSLAIDADLTTTPDIRGDRRFVAAGGELWVAKGLVGLRTGARWNTARQLRSRFFRRFHSEVASLGACRGSGDQMGCSG